MKTFAFIACFAVSCILVADAAFEDVPQSVKQAHDDCQSNPATHLDESVFKAMRKGESFDRHLAGVHMLCMNKKLGNQNEDGSVNKEKIKKIFAKDNTDESKVNEITNKCAEQGTTPEETALKLTKCIYENTKRDEHNHEGHSHSEHSH